MKEVKKDGFRSKFTITFNNSLDATGGKSDFFHISFSYNNLLVYLRPNRDCNSMLQSKHFLKEVKERNGRTSNSTKIGYGDVPLVRVPFSSLSSL